MLGSRGLQGLQGSGAGFSQRQEDGTSLTLGACLEALPPAQHGRVIDAADFRALAYAFLLRDRMEEQKPLILAAQAGQAGAGQGIKGALAIRAAITWEAARRPPSLHIDTGTVRTSPACSALRCFSGGTSMLLISSAIRYRITTHCAAGRVGRTAVPDGRKRYAYSFVPSSSFLSILASSLSALPFDVSMARLRIGARTVRARMPAPMVITALTMNTRSQL